ncbi:MAG: LD-carboxypeptidase [Deltaproteobacteria bacterium]|nr:LD-carboxypeptidase [Deltaproteobacteria bacterium]
MTHAAAPPRIALGQSIGICAPAGPVKTASQAQLQRGLDRLSAFKLQLAPTLTSPRPVDLASYLAAPDDQRAGELMAMIRDPDVRAIVLARGGYGIARILDRLDASDLQRDPKPIVGFSDATALLAWAHAAGVRGIHGPMVVQLGNLPASDAARLIAMLTDPAPLGHQPWALDARGTGTHRGALIPANLTMASMLVGTRWPLPLAGAIALFEEIGEKPYELDRYLTQLAATGALRDTRAVLLGDLTRCIDPNPPTGEPDPDDAAQRTISERLDAFGKPHAFGAPVGHGDRNEAVPFGAACELDLDARRLTILDGAVA